ncbi:MAG: hypothetical protein NTY38_28745, partial [Acidobacteria bacterium]|nr:hypothetical protein [Acidobacteriota bacterium]
MAGAVLVGLHTVDEQGSRGTAIEPEELDGAGFGFRKDGSAAPGAATVVGEDEERILGRGAEDLSGDPAVFEVDELELIEPCAGNAFEGLGPAFAVVEAAEQDGTEGGGVGMDIAGDEEPGAKLFHVDQFEVDGATLIAGA